MKFQKLGVALFLLLIVTAGLASIVYTNIRLRHHPEYLSGTVSRHDQPEKAHGQIITLTETQAGMRKWVLIMKEIKYNKDNNTAKLIDIHGQVYGDKQDVQFTFAAPSGVYVKDARRITLTDGATMFSPSAKVTIRSPQMVWSSSVGKVHATGGVNMTKEGVGTTHANTAVFSTDFSQIRFIGDAKSIMGSPSTTGDKKTI